MARTPPGPPVADLVSSAARREILGDPVSPGYSGALLERMTLEDGRRLILKTASPSTDLAMAVTADPGRAFLFHTEGFYDRLPPSIECPVIAVDQHDGAWRMAMDDVSDRLISEGRSISRAENRRILAAVRNLHSSFSGETSPLLSSLEDHLTMFAPTTLTRFVDGPNPLPGYAMHAWETFSTVAPEDVRAATLAVQSSPTILADRLRAGGTTLTHANLAFANIGLTDDAVIILDFALACRAPGSFDFAIYLMQNDWLIDATNDEVVEDWLDLSAGADDASTLRLALLAAFVEYGCWKAPDPARPSPYCETFGWWSQAGRAGIEAIR